LDGRAFDAIRGLSVTEALAVLAELRQTNLEHVSNKSAFLCGLIKTFRQKSKLGNVARNGDARVNSIKPDEAKIKVSMWVCQCLILCSKMSGEYFTVIDSVFVFVFYC